MTTNLPLYNILPHPTPKSPHTNNNLVPTSASTKWKNCNYDMASGVCVGTYEHVMW